MVALAMTPPSHVVSKPDGRRCSDDVPPGHDNWRPVMDLRCQKLEVDRVGPRGQMFDELKVGNKVNITARAGVPSGQQVAGGRWPPSRYLRSASYMEGALPVLV